MKLYYDYTKCKVRTKRPPLLCAVGRWAVQCSTLCVGECVALTQDVKVITCRLYLSNALCGAGGSKGQEYTTKGL